MRRWPSWWDSEIELTLHLQKRMAGRNLSEIELRQMLDRAHHLRAGHVPGRWVVETRLHHRPWDITVEPDPDPRVLAVITAYPRPS